MSKPLIFLFLFQLIISIDLPNTRSVNNKAEVKEIPINAIYKSIDNLFANYDIYRQINSDFDKYKVDLNVKIAGLPIGYKSCKTTPYNYMEGAKFYNPSEEVLGIKIFKNEKESLNFIKNELKNELSNKTVFPINDGNVEKVRNSIEKSKFKKNIWKKVDLIVPLKKLRFLSIFFTKIDDDKFVIVYYYLNSEITWCYEYFVLINISEDDKNSLLVFDPKIIPLKKDNEMPEKYKEFLIRYFSIFSYKKIHNLYGEGDYISPDFNY